MKKKTYFLIVSFFLLFMITNVSYAHDNQIKEEDLTNQNLNQDMLVNKNLINDNIEINKNLINKAIEINKNSINQEDMLIDEIRVNNNQNSINITNSITNLSTTTKKTKTKLKTINESQFYRDKYVVLELVDDKNKRIPNIPVYMTLTHNKVTKTYKLGTNTKGIVKVEIRFNDTYSVKFEFKGTSKYLPSNSSKITVVKNLSLSTIQTQSKNLKDKIENGGKIPKNITINKITYNTEEFLYLLGKSVLNLNKKSKSSIKLKYIPKASYPDLKELSGKIYKSEYIKLTNNLLKFMDSNKRAPNYVSSSLGKIPYNQVVHIYSKIVNFYRTEKILPNYVTLEKLSSFKKKTVIKGSNGAIYTIEYSVLNDIYKNEDLSKYLSASKNCQSTNSEIKKIAKSLTSSVKDTYLKAKAIFNYVRDKISYLNYNNTKNGAVKTLTKKSGNCVDKAHLLIAIARASGIPARYVHGTNCKFTSGRIYGHVWVQLLIGNTWVVADTTSSKNSLGVVKNWNTNNYYLVGKSSSLSF